MPVETLPLSSWDRADHYWLLGRAVESREGLGEASKGDIMARVYADVNQQMPRAYWDYDSVNISWGVLENYEVVRKIGTSRVERVSELSPHVSTIFSEKVI